MLTGTFEQRVNLVDLVTQVDRAFECLPRNGNDWLKIDEQLPKHFRKSSLANRFGGEKSVP